MSGSGTIVMYDQQGDSVPIVALRHDGLDGDRNQYALATFLAENNARPKIISALTGLRPTQAKRMLELAGAKAPVGRQASTLGPMLTPAILHLHASYYLHTYMRVAGPSPSALSPKHFRAAWSCYEDMVEAAEGDQRLDINQSFVIAGAHVRGEVQLGHCDICHTYFMQTSRPVQVGSGYTAGDCPYCRVLNPRLRRNMQAKTRRETARRTIAKVVSSP